MATILGTENVSVKTTRRTWRTNIESARGAAPAVTAYRETIKELDPSGELLSQDNKGGSDRVDRSLPAVLGENVTLADGTVISVAQIAEAIPLLVERWESEDIAARAAAASPAE